MATGKWETAKFGEVKQADLEALVRAAWNRAKTKGWEQDPAGMAVAISRIVSVLVRQPDLIDGVRLNHNLGKTKMEWVRGLMADYKEAL
jgi:hypothetical protein